MTKVAKKFVDKIRSNTHCKKCGIQPVVYHDPTSRHRKDNKLRVGNMIHDGRSCMEILLEILKCTPLCSSCHQKAHKGCEDPIRECIECGEKKKINAREMCNSCYPKYMRKNKPKIICIECGKKKTIDARGMCQPCYKRFMRRNKWEKKAIHGKSLRV